MFDRKGAYFVYFLLTNGTPFTNLFKNFAPLLTAAVKALSFEYAIVNPMVIGSNTIERVMTYKLLGVYVSNDLKRNHHEEVIVQKGNRKLYSLRVLKQCGAPPASLAKVYTTIVRPVLEYAAPVWQIYQIIYRIRLSVFRKGLCASVFL